MPKIIVGFRTRSGHLSKIEELETHRIPKMVQQHGIFVWNGSTCINATAAFLQFLKRTITGPGVWRITKVPNDANVQVRRIADTGIGNIISPGFLAWRQELEARR